jgi:hypothetical protein
MTLNRLLITSVVNENRPVAHVAAQYGVSESWLFELLARYKAEGDAAFEPHSRRPHSVPTTTPAETVDLILELREKLTATGLDAGPDTIKWHLEHHHSIAVSRATISRYLTKAGLVVPEPKKKPKSYYIRFAAEMPNETWQADFTHYRLRRPDGRSQREVEACLRRTSPALGARSFDLGPPAALGRREEQFGIEVPASSRTSPVRHLAFLSLPRLAGGGHISPQACV